MKKKKYSLTVGWLYPDLMNTYGDRGNIIVFTKRSQWRGIDIRLEEIYVDSKPETLQKCDLLFMGGAQDTQQEIVNEDLLGKRGEIMAKLIEDGLPGLFICGAYQFLGEYYKTADDKNLKGLGVFPLYTENPGASLPRLIGNIIVNSEDQKLIGFENHGGRTYLKDKTLALGSVEKGFGNNGEDKTEGIIYKNAFGTYMHGPILPKNPQLADKILTLALERKYKEKFHLETLDDSIEQKAREQITKRVK